MNHSVTVPAHVLQDLIFNAGLSAIALGPDMDRAVSEQTAELQACIDEQVGDSDTVYGRPKGTSAAPGFELAFVPADDSTVVALFGDRR